MPTLTRSDWIALLLRVVEPPLAARAEGRLRATFPVRTRPGKETEREDVTHLEAVGRALNGLAPWLELSSVSDTEDAAQGRMREPARVALAEGPDPSSPDVLNFTAGDIRQPLVDTAFLAQALPRAPHNLHHSLDPVVRERLLATLRATRVITPNGNNWLLFFAMIEAALLKLDGQGELLRIDYAIPVRFARAVS